MKVTREEMNIAQRWYYFFTETNVADHTQVKAEATRILQAEDGAFALIFADNSVLSIRQEPTSEASVFKHYYRCRMVDYETRTRG